MPLSTYILMPFPNLFTDVSELKFVLAPIKSKEPLKIYAKGFVDTLYGRRIDKGDDLPS